MIAADSISRVAAPVAAADAESFHLRVLESLSEGVMITDAQYHIRYANRVVSEMTGFTPEELIGASPASLFVDVSRPTNAQCNGKENEALSEKEETAEIEITRKDGRLSWVRLRSTPMRDENGRIMGRVATLACIEKEKSLEMENEVLQEDIRLGFGDIVGRSAALQKVLSQIATVAPTEANILILGESGTGKELVARAIHDLSPRKDRPLVRVNCASIPKELFESEFFGHVRGAFTGALKDRAGRFELADGGTLLLDEVGEIPLELQSKLLRVLQEGTFERLGDERTRTVKVRVIAATNRDLAAEARAGRFRQDLYYRLSVFPIELPPLRERLEDIGELAENFIKQAARRLGVARPRLTKLAVQQLQAYDWPGNVRELQNVIERAVILARGGRLQFDLPQARVRAEIAGPVAASSHARESGNMSAAGGQEEEALSLDELAVRERQIVQTALERRHWKIYGKDGAAELLRVKPTTLVSMMKRLNIARPRAPAA